MAMALWHYGTMELWHYGTLALWEGGNGLGRGKMVPGGGLRVPYLSFTTISECSVSVSDKLTAYASKC
jgi:hypothetical protein